MAEQRTFDSIIIGAGISGINLAYRLQTQLPNHTYAILEARNAIGGTWDLFKYPGIRSDSDLYTFGFPWRPWSEQTNIAEGGAITKYMRESAEMYGIDEKIRFGRNVTGADWKSDGQEWVLQVEEEGKEMEYRSRFLMFCTGYYVRRPSILSSIVPLTICARTTKPPSRPKSPASTTSKDKSCTHNSGLKTSTTKTKTWSS